MSDKVKKCSGVILWIIYFLNVDCVFRLLPHFKTVQVFHLLRVGFVPKQFVILKHLVGMIQGRIHNFDGLRHCRQLTSVQPTFSLGNHIRDNNYFFGGDMIHCTRVVRDVAMVIYGQYFLTKVWRLYHFISVKSEMSFVGWKKERFTTSKDQNFVKSALYKCKLFSSENKFW